MVRIMLAFSAAALAATAAPRIADACSQPRCYPGYLVPGDGARVPANLPAVTWHAMRDNHDSEAPDPALVELREVSGDAIPLAPTELEYGDYRLDLDAPLEPGTSYRLTDDTVCGDGFEEGPRVTLEATAEAPYPEALGRIEVVREDVDDNLLIGTASGSCTTGTVSAVARVELEPSAEAEPWVDALHFETIVDGELWTATSAITATHPPGESWIGRGRDLLYHVCRAKTSAEPFPGLDEGRHEVVFRATLPGTDVSLETQPVPVDLDCGGGIEPPTPDRPDADEPTMAGCALAPGTGGGGGAAALVAALALILRRRRIR